MSALLVPFDGSDFALHALDHAVALARSTAAVVHVLNVYEEPIAYAWSEVTLYYPRAELLAYLRQTSAALLEAAAGRVRAAGVACVAASATGPIADSIVRYAREQRCDAIVMGTHGRGALGGLVMGSVATRVVHLADVPVTLIK